MTGGGGGDLFDSDCSSQSEGQHSSDEIQGQPLIADVLRQDGRNKSMFLYTREPDGINNSILSELFDTMKEFRGKDMILMLLAKKKMTK